MLCIEHTFGVDTRGISLVYVLCAKYLKNCSSTNCTKKVQFLHKISLNKNFSLTTLVLTGYCLTR